MKHNQKVPSNIILNIGIKKYFELTHDTLQIYGAYSTTVLIFLQSLQVDLKVFTCVFISSILNNAASHLYISVIISLLSSPL
jgi:hypothetical protein